METPGPTTLRMPWKFHFRAGNSVIYSMIQTCGVARLTASQGETASQPNKAWLWAKENNLQGEFCQPCDRDLMAWGYVFWDGERLQKMRVVEEPRYSTGSIAARTTYES